LCIKRLVFTSQLRIPDFTQKFVWSWKYFNFLKHFLHHVKFIYCVSKRLVVKLTLPLFRLMVDMIPIRVYRNHADKGVAFPRWQPMSLKATLWNGDSWATRGGQDKIDWTKGPFIASFRNYKIDACVWKGNPRFCRAASPTNWWNQYSSSTLTSTQRRWFKWVRKYHMIYDYCQDNERFQNNLPRECSLLKYWSEMRMIASVYIFFFSSRF